MVSSLLDKTSALETVALRAQPVWTAGEVEAGGRRVVVVPCRSPIDARMNVAQWPEHRGDGDILVLLCDLSESELGDDLVARLTPSRVYGIEPWTAAQQLFGASRLDAGFTKEGDGWIADALVQYVKESDARPLVNGGALTREVARLALAKSLLGAERFDVDALLAASAMEHAFLEFQDLQEDLQQALLDEFAAANGAVGEWLVALFRTTNGQDLLAYGLVLGAVYADGENRNPQAAGVLEGQIGAAPEASVASVLAARAGEVFDRTQRDAPEQAALVVARANAVAAELPIEDGAVSSFLDVGLDARIRLLGDAILGVLDALSLDDQSGAADSVEQVRSALELVRSHAAPSRYDAAALRLTHAEMAARLAAWLVDAAVEVGASLEELSSAFRAQGAWVDRARRRLWRGDNDAEVQQVYRQLLDTVVERRREQNRGFAERLVQWTADGSPRTSLAEHGLVPVERVIGDVLTPLAKTMPVLLVVLDGCGLPSFCELADQFRVNGFREIAHGAHGGTRITGIAALPTVTEVSRASLLSGALAKGPSALEKANFAKAAPGPNPKLFMQAELRGPAGNALAPAVATAIASPAQTVVAAVINTIDDQLARGNFTSELRLSDLGALTWLLDAAASAGRAVIITADHGHVLEQPPDGGPGNYAGGGDGGQRWQEADRAPGPGEVRLAGDRVLLGGDAGVIAPWEDDYRYAARAGGYHGGVTPEEVLVPVAVFTPLADSEAPKGWESWGDVAPIWWDVRVTRRTVEAGAAGKRPRRKPKLEGQGAMFGEPTPPGAGAVAVPAWVDGVLASEVWKAQRAANPRLAADNEKVRSALATLALRGGVAAYAAIASDAGVRIVQVGGFLANLSRMLNVDGYVILQLDAAAEDARLNIELLAQQFGLELT